MTPDAAVAPRMRYSGRMERPPIVWIFLGAMLLIGATLGAVLWRIRRLRRAVAESMAWPTARGRIVETEIRQSKVHLPKGGRATLYHAILVYEYAAGGRSYRGDKFDLDGPQVSASRVRADEHLRKYPPGTEVLVYYDPARPERSALTHRSLRVVTLWIVVGLLVVLGVGVFSLFAFVPGMFGPGPWIKL
jgi:hypothetical protein